MARFIFEYIKLFWKGKLSEYDNQKLFAEIEKNQQAIEDSLYEKFSDKEMEREYLDDLEDRSALILEKIYGRIGVRDQPKVKRIWPMMWRVASVAACLALGYYVLDMGNQSKLGKDNIEELTVAERRDTTIRSGTETLLYTLSDGSAVTLYAHSAITLDIDYGKTNRDIKLEGTARFEVAKSKDVPFNVSSNGYVTTAIGTEFVVDGSDRYLTYVQLLSGKVVVKSTSSSMMAIADTYLEPGQQLRIDLKRLYASVYTVDVPSKDNATAHVDHTPPQEAVSTADHEYLVFDQKTLTEVFSTLVTTYGVDIDFDSNKTEDLYFTGKFSNKTALPIILKVVADMNDLEVLVDNENTYRIVEKSMVENRTTNNNHQLESN